jgi:glycosyltransferase involved in cell wall biosynthesis/putative flippase GtrA
MRAQAFGVAAYAGRLQDLYAALAPGALAKPSPALSASAAAGPAARDTAPAARLRALWIADKLAYEDRLHDVGRYYWTVVPALTDVEVIAAVLRSTNGLIRQFQRHGIPLQSWQLGRFNPWTLWRLVRCIRREHIAILHVHGYGASTFGRVAGWLTRTPVIVHQHDSAAEAPGYVRFLDRLLSALTTQALAVSESVKQFCIAARSLPPERVQVWPNGVTVAAHVPDPLGRARLRRVLGIPADHQVIGTIGRLTTEKGLRYLLEAAARVVRLQPQTTLLIIGEGVLRAQLESLAQRLGVAGHVRWLGQRADAEELLGVMDCFVLASVTEGSPFELLEAMGAGVPIVATAVGGTLDVLRHGHSGWLVPSRDPRSLADGILQVLADGALQAQLGRGALASVRAYDLKRYAQQLSALYQRVVTEQGVAAPLTRSPWWQQLQTFLRYAVVGVGGGTLHMGTLWLLVEQAQMPVLPATTLGFVLAVINNFILNRIWTFRSLERNVRLQFTRFLAVSLCGLALNNLSMTLMTGMAGWPYLWAQLATMALVWGWNFFANTYWTFQPLRFQVPAASQVAYPYDLSIVVPAYNEEARLPNTVAAMAQYCRTHGLRAELLVVDDGSTDRTLEVATQLPAEGVRLRLLHQPENQGKGAAVRAGLRAAEGAYILMADADNSVPIECLEACWPLRAPQRILIGSRYLRGRRQGQTSRSRYWLGRLSNWIIRGALLPGITDSQCGFKLFSHASAKALVARQRVEGFGFDMELLAIARAIGIEVQEFEIHWQPIPGSRVRPLRDAWRALGELALVKWSLWSGVYHTQERFQPPAAAPVIAAPVVSA